MNHLSKTDLCLSAYFTAVAFLHVATKLQGHGLNDELMDILAAVLGLFRPTDIRRMSYYSTSVMSLKAAVKLMKIVANESLSTMSLIEIKLSKAYLHRALRCNLDSDSDSIYCLANVYLAVLYYTTGQWQTAVDHCTLVTRSRDHSQCSSHVVQGNILPKIDDDVDSMLGMVELYQSVRTVAMKEQRQPQFVSVLTTELFAYYLHVKYLSVTRCSQLMQPSSADELRRYGICISDAQQLFISDMLLFLSVGLRRQLKFQHKNLWMNGENSVLKANTCNAPELTELLQKSAVEQLTTYRQLVARFGPGATITTDFEALHAYKRGDYQQCLQLSTQNLHTLEYAVSAPALPILPDFNQLLDDDIVSLTALTLIVNPKCRDDAGGFCISQLTLTLYLMAQCQLKLHHSVTSLAQTLDYIEVAQSVHSAISADLALDQLTLKLLERKVVAYIRSLVFIT